MSRTWAEVGAALGAAAGGFGGAMLGIFPTANDWRRQQGLTVTRKDEEDELNRAVNGGYIGAIVGGAIGAAIGAGSSAPEQQQRATGVHGHLSHPSFP